MLPDDTNPVESDGTAAFENHITDNLIHAEVNLPQEKKIQDAKVIGSTKDHNDETVDKHNENPLFNSIFYYIEFPDG